MPWFDEVLVDRRAPVINIAESFFMRSLLRQPWDIIVDLQCSRRTTRYFQFFVRPNVRWVGTVKDCSDPCPDFTGVNNYQRMMIAVGLAGGAMDEGGDMRWLLQAAHRKALGNIYNRRAAVDKHLIKPWQHAGQFSKSRRR